jgi:hypothetical protein
MTQNRPNGRTFRHEHHENRVAYLSREKNRHGNECLFVRRHGKRVRIREPENTPAFAKSYSDALDALEKPFEANERARKEAAKAGTMGWLATRYFAECEEYKGLYEKSRNARRSCIEDCLQAPRKPDTPKDLMRDCRSHNSARLTSRCCATARQSSRDLRTIAANTFPLCVLGRSMKS